MTPSITIFSATSRRVPEHKEAQRRTSACLPVPHVCRMYVAPLSWQSIREYNRFIHMRAVDFLGESSHMLIVHWDGYGINLDRWQDKFLDYDYIGAPWPKDLNPARVGNGGFSLRSRKWLELQTQLPLSDDPEDTYFCHKHRQFFLDHGMKIAPLYVAAGFALEHPVPEYPRTLKDVFGFHGAWHPGALATFVPKFEVVR